MSGFVGVVNRDRVSVDPAVLDRLTEAMAFRGPDAQQSWREGGIGLGAALLRSTLEAEREVQPASLDGALWIVADVRLDAREALIAELRGQGQLPSPQTSDPELVLHAYAAWGRLCVDHLSGDFAFGIWDSREKRLFCARDHFGVAQFFYARVRESLVFGNTLQALLMFPGISTGLDAQAIADCALLGHFGDPDATAYSSIHRLPQGHTLTWGDSGLRLERYWSPPVSLPVLKFRDPEEYVRRFRIEFDRAVSDRLRIDRAACQLSGGMDSTSIAATAHLQLSSNSRAVDFRTYTIAYRQLLKEEEGALAAQVASFCGFPLETIVTEDYLGEGLPRNPTWIPPEPGILYSPPERETFVRVAQFSRVLLVGFGGDPALQIPPLSLPGAWVALMRGERHWLRRSLRRTWKAHCRGARPPAMPSWAHPRLLERFDLASRLSRFRRPASSHRPGMVDAPLWRSFFALADPGSSGFAVRVRFPFFDRKLYELILALPPAPWCERKLILRRAMDGRLPPSVLSRPKTPLPGSPRLAFHRQGGVPAWEFEALAAPEMADILDPQWLRRLKQLPAERQAAAWHQFPPPVDLAYWLRHRSKGGDRA